MRHGNDAETEPLLAGGGPAGLLVWWPLLSVVYLLVLRRWEPVGVVVLGCALVGAAMLRSALRVGLSGARPRR